MSNKANSKYPAKIIIATGTFMNVTIDLIIDTEDMKASKDIIKAFHRHFHGLLDGSTDKIINQLNNDKSNTKTNSELDVVYDMED